MKLKNLFNRDMWDTRITMMNRTKNIRRFIKTYYYASRWHGKWKGVETLKSPTDLWVYQEFIYSLRPDFIIETGTFNGGSALYMASICDMIGHGQIITIDINPCDTEHDRITKIVDKEGSTSPHVIEKVKNIVGDGKCLVMLDSTHRKEHVLKEMELYQQFVPIDYYMVVEDTCLGGNPVLPSWGDGPYDSVKEFTKKYDTFQIDKKAEKFFLTMHPNGFLKRVK